MEKILAYLQDPAWWFSTVLVAIIVSVVAGFLRDKIASALGHLSNKFKDWSTKRKQQREELIRVLSENPHYLHIAFTRVVLMSVMFMGTIIIYFLLPIYAEFKPMAENPNVNSALNKLLSIFFYPFVGGISMGFGYRATSGLNIVAAAVKKYRKTNGLPKLP